MNRKKILISENYIFFKGKILKKIDNKPHNHGKHNDNNSDTDAKVDDYK